MAAKLELMAASQDVASGNLVPVNINLNPRKQIWNTLNFVNDRAIRKLRQKTARVGTRKFAHVRLLQVGIRLIRKSHAAKRCLP